MAKAGLEACGRKEEEVAAAPVVLGEEEEVEELWGW